MKILRVISSVNPQAGGPINGLVNSSKGLIDKGHTVVVASLDDPESDFVNSFTYELYTFSSSLGVYSYSPNFKKWLQKNVKKFDVIIVHGLWQFHSIAVATMCKEQQVPYVVFTHGMLDPWFNEVYILKAIKKKFYWWLFEKRVINQASAVLFTSEEEKKLARKSFRPYNPKEVVVSYGSHQPLVDIDKSIDIFIRKFPVLSGKRCLLYMSRIHTKKGIDLLIDAFSKISYSDDLCLVIAGPDNDGLRARLEEQAVKLGVADKIVWTGMLNGDLKWGAYHASDVFILPSHQENFGIVVAEALSTSTPVLITNKVNIWREVEAYGAGIVGNDNVDGIVDVLSKWLSFGDRELEAMRRNALLCYGDRFSIQSAVHGLEKQLLSVIEGYDG